jgi:hypothetical protein
MYVSYKLILKSDANLSVQQIYGKFLLLDKQFINELGEFKYVERENTN